MECWDRHLKKRVAVKIVRAIEKYRDAAKLEIEVLETLQRYDPYYDQYVTIFKEKERKKTKKQKTERGKQQKRREHN